MYFATHKHDLQKVIDSLAMDENEVVIDLGAGIGTVIFEAAKQAKEKNLKTQFVGIDIHLIMVLILWLRRLFHPNKENIHIVWSDIFKCHFDHYVKPDKTSLYFYLSPWLTKGVGKLISGIEGNTHIVSYKYPLEAFKEHGRVAGKTNDIFIYKTK